MPDLTLGEVLVLGLGGAFLIGTCVIETPLVLTVRTLCFAMGVAMLAFAFLCMLFAVTG